MPLFAATIFVSAFLLFLVQPLIGKFILPWFGGSPGVWTTCLLFFQTLLLGGYAYAHALSTRFPPRTQGVVHVVLLGLALLWLPIAPDVAWQPEPGTEPTLRILLLLTATLGLPFGLLAATGPLLQRWFHYRYPTHSPYRLYALSNAGSLLALLGYPFLIEPNFSRMQQAWGWSVAWIFFAVLCVLCARRVRILTTVSDVTSSTENPPETAEKSAAETTVGRWAWILLPALASVLLIATTSKLCVDVAVIPFLWVLPLSLYLVTFILCFDHPRWYSRGVFCALFVVGCVSVGYLLVHGANAPVPLQLVAYGGTLFAAGMICHGELYRLRPAPAQLTAYYLWISAGGALGGLFVAIIAPLLFRNYYEFQLGLWLVAVVLAWLAWQQRSRAIVVGAGVGALLGLLVLPALSTEPAATGIFAWGQNYADEFLHCTNAYWPWTLPVLVAVAVLFLSGAADQRRATRTWHALLPSLLVVMLGAVFLLQIRNGQTDVVAASRNFYGALQVRTYGAPGSSSHNLVLSHGITTHGLQFTEEEYTRWPTTYYGAASGIGLALDAIGAASAGRHIGVVGLGVGTLATFGHPADRLRFYEIDPMVVQLARERFTYLAQTEAAVQIVLGDARLTLAAERQHRASQQFDLLALDAFSSDAIPIHLLTVEAMAIYLEHLKSDGVIAVHISNRHLDLRPVLEALAAHFALSLVTVSHNPDEDDWWLYRTTWVLLSRDTAKLLTPAILEAADEPSDDTATRILWTDDRAGLFGVLR